MISKDLKQKELIEFFYINIRSSKNPWKEFPFRMIELEFSNIHPVDLMFYLDQLYNENLIDKRWYPSRSDNVFLVKLKGALLWEKEYSAMDDYYGNLRYIMLKLLRDVELEKVKLLPGKGQQWGIIPFSDFYKLTQINVDQLNDARFIIHYMGMNHIRRDACGFTKDGMIFFGQGKPILLSEGRINLNGKTKLMNLFHSIKNPRAKNILIEEYNDIGFLKQQHKWKDAAIKMGSILDFLLYNLFDQKKIKIAKPDFHKRLKYVMKNNLIGNPNDWLRADQILRDYRNLVHLQELITQNINVDEQTIILIETIFHNLISLF